MVKRQHEHKIGNHSCPYSAEAAATTLGPILGIPGFFEFAWAIQQFLAALLDLGEIEAKVRGAT